MTPRTFFFGEFAKIAITIALMAAIAVWYQELNWLAMLVAFIVALKSYAVLLFRH
jgi:ATP synthase protein I